MTTRTTTRSGLRTYLLDSIFEVHRGGYPADMTFEQFDEQLDMFQEGMNDNNNCNFPSMAMRTLKTFYVEYHAELVR